MIKLVVAFPKYNEINSAKKLCGIINKFPGPVDIYQKHAMVDGKSLLGIISIALNEPMFLMIYDEETSEQIINELKMSNIFVAISE